MVAMPLPTMSNAVPCAGVVKTVSRPAGHGDAAVEALELGRDLALVVVHREHAVELARRSP